MRFLFFPRSFAGRGALVLSLAGAAMLTSPPARADGAAAPVARDLDALATLLDGQLLGLGDVRDRLNALLARGATPKAKAAAEKLLARIEGLNGTLAPGRDRARASRGLAQTTDADAKALRASLEPPLRDASDVIQQGLALADDPKSIDTSAAEAEKQRAAAEAKASADAAKRAELDAKRAEADQRRADAARAKADAAAEKQRAAAEKAGARLDELDRAVAEGANVAEDAAHLLDDFRRQRRLSTKDDADSKKLVDRLGATRGKLDDAGRAITAARSGKAGGVDALRGRVASVVKDLRALAASCRSFVAAAQSPVLPATPDPAPAPVTDSIVPTCDITFDRSGGDTQTSLGLDGQKPRPLPFTARVASGRHQLHVVRGTAAEDRSELLLCGRITTLPIDPPR